MKFSDFKKIVYSLKMPKEMEIISFSEAGVTPNFHVAYVKEGISEFCILSSIQDEWAFSERLAEFSCDLSFIDRIDLAFALKEGFGIITRNKKELDASFVLQDYMHESDVKYWAPKSLGTGMFNWWD